MYPRNRNLNEDGTISEKGFSTIENCLIAAYEAADFLFINREILHERIIESEPERMLMVAKMEILRAEFPEEKRRQRYQYRQNRLSQTQYTQIQKAYQVEIEALETRVSDFNRNIFSGFPGHQVCHGTEKQDIQFVMKHHTE